MFALLKMSEYGLTLDRIEEMIASYILSPTKYWCLIKSAMSSKALRKARG